jgi:hypothetical protein
VRLYQLTQVHTKEVIASQNENLPRLPTADAVDLAAHCVRTSLAPSPAIQRLFGCQYLNRSPGQNAELVGMAKVAMQRGREDLGEDKDVPDAGVDAVAKWNVDQAELTADGNRWFALLSG